MGYRQTARDSEAYITHLLHVIIAVISDPKGRGTAGKRIIFEFSSIFEFYHLLAEFVKSAQMQRSMFLLL